MAFIHFEMYFNALSNSKLKVCWDPLLRTIDLENITVISIQFHYCLGDTHEILKNGMFLSVGCRSGFMLISSCTRALREAPAVSQFNVCQTAELGALGGLTYCLQGVSRGYLHSSFIKHQQCHF